MTAPLRTAAQFLEEAGFGTKPNETLSFPEWPDVNAQLQALRKLDPRAREISWIEYHLDRARAARKADDLKREAEEVANARRVVEQSFKRRTPTSGWKVLGVLLALIAAAGTILWWQQRRRKRLARRQQNVPLLTDGRAQDDDDVDDDAEEDDEDA